MGCTDSKAHGDKVDKPTHGPNDRGRMLKLDGILSEPTGDIRDHYSFGKLLGKGNFGVVHLVTERKTGKTFACKSISKRKLVQKEDVDDVKREVQILLHLSGHPNVVQMYAAYEDSSYIHFVIECCEGGELFDRIAEQGKFSERDAARYMRTIVSVVNHCHTMNVVHRDLKENFLLSSKGHDAVLKATDFGLSRFFKEGERLDEIVGSPFYVAPEVLQRNYGKEADIWSCGVILYILLAGYPPFHGDSTQQIFKRIVSQALDLRSEPWPRISDAAKRCVKAMLTRDPRKRLTAEQLLRHDWMKENGAAIDEPMQPEVLKRLKQFGKMNALKKEALKVIANSLPQAEIQGMKEMFKALDADGSGCITVEELKEGLRKKGAALNGSEVEKILDQIDMDGNQRLDYEEFLAATVHMNKLNREELMIDAFKHFDKDNSGSITTEELNMALQEAGLDPKELTSILKAADTNNDNCIDYEEFCVMMRNNDFEELVQAKRALKSKIWVAPPDLDDLKAPPEEEDGVF